MSLKIVIDGLRPVSNEVWETTLGRDELGCLNSPWLREGEVSVLIVRDPDVSEDGRLAFSPDQAPVVNLGNGERVVIIAARGRAAHARVGEEAAPMEHAQASAPDRPSGPVGLRPEGASPAAGAISEADEPQRDRGGAATVEPLRPGEPRNPPPWSA